MKILLLIIFITSISVLLLSCSKKREPVDSIDGWGFANVTDSYDIGKEDEKYNGEPVYYLMSNRKVTTGFGGICKPLLDPAEFLGKRVRLSGYIKTDDVDTSGMWMRVDSASAGFTNVKTLSFDNMTNRPIMGTTDWKKYEIVLDVPKNSRVIYYGPLLGGNGKLWFSCFKLDTVGNDVPTTDIKK